jgi:hypothetical protein
MTSLEIKRSGHIGLLGSSQGRHYTNLSARSKRVLNMHRYLLAHLGCSQLLREEGGIVHPCAIPSNINALYGNDDDSSHEARRKVFYRLIVVRDHRGAI